MSTIKDRRGLSLPPKITVSVYWALMLAGLIAAPIVLRDLERELTEERGRQADLFAYYLTQYLDQNSSATDEQVRNEVEIFLSRRLAVDAVAVTRRGRTLHVGRAGRDAASVVRTLLSRSAASGLETAQATLYQPNLERAGGRSPNSRASRSKCRSIPACGRAWSWSCRSARCWRGATGARLRSPIRPRRFTTVADGSRAWSSPRPRPAFPGGARPRSRPAAARR